MTRGAMYMIALCAVVAVGCTNREADVPDEPLHAALTLSTNMLHVGDQASMALTVYHPTAGDLHVPDLNEGASLLIRDQSIDTKPLTDERARTIHTYAFTSFATGQHVVATNQITFKGANSGELVVGFPFATFDVVSLVKTNSALRGHKGYETWNIRFLDSPAAVLIAICLVVALLALLLLALLSIKRKEATKDLPPLRPPDEIALERLKALQEKGYMENMEHEPFYVELSDIVRHYLEGRFALHAPDRTTEEFLREAASTNVLSREHQNLTASFLEQCDLVKFARHTPNREAMNDGIMAATRLILETRKPPALPEETAA